MTNLDKLKSLLAELFMLDQADLDFGICARGRLAKLGSPCSLRLSLRSGGLRCGPLVLASHPNSTRLPTRFGRTPGTQPDARVTASEQEPH